MTREEHIEWCKKRAIEEMDYYNDPNKALISMMSDLRKHEKTNSNHNDSAVDTDQRRFKSGRALPNDKSRACAASYTGRVAVDAGITIAFNV